MIVIVSNLDEPGFMPIALSRTFLILEDSAIPVGILVREAAPTKPEAPCTSTRDGKSGGIHFREI